MKKERPVEVRLDPRTVSRIQAAWKELSPKQQIRIAPLILKAHENLLKATDPVIAHNIDSSCGSVLPFAYMAITGDDTVISRFNTFAKLDIPWPIDDGGEIWGPKKYEQLDLHPGWLEAVGEWLEHFVVPNHDFSTTPSKPTQMTDDVKIALAGDWGTTLKSTQNVAKAIKDVNPDFTIHLGDIYYSGTKDEERDLLLAGWPAGSKGSLALNSNHEMYSGAGAYFNAINTTPFKENQRGCSYYALYNEHWLLLGLDSAYYSGQGGLYRDGALYPADSNDDGGNDSDSRWRDQLAFMEEQLSNARGKKIILLTHHNGLVQDGSAIKDPLWSQVMKVFWGGPYEGPHYWYWGHVHVGAIYGKQFGNVNCRCCGHGGLPCGRASEMDHKSNVVWYENRPAGDSDYPQRVVSGFAVVRLNGPDIEEHFYDETGRVAPRSTIK